MSVYLDACVLVPLFVVEPSSADIRAFVHDATGEMVVSDLAIAEFGAALSQHVRSNRTTEDVARGILSLFDDWINNEVMRFPTESEDVRRASDLVRKFELKLLTPDAIHLALCERHGLTLATLDKRLASAAEALGVACVVP